MEYGDSYLDPCCGRNRVFYDLCPLADKDWCEIELGRNFYHWGLPVDWIVSNPPYYRFWKFQHHASWLARKGMGWLLNRDVFSVYDPNRLSQLARSGWHMRLFRILRVAKWSRPYYFVLFLRERGDLDFSWLKGVYR